MKKKLVCFAGLMAASLIVAGCGSAGKDKAYLEGIKAADYVKIGEYKGIEVTQAEPEITDEYRDSYINYMLSMNPDRGIIEGDTANIDYEGKLDGVAFEGGTAQGANLTIGSGQFIEGFEEGLVGAKIGETRDLNLTFPADYTSAEMAGKSVVFTVKVNSIMAGEPQELTDEYVKNIEGIECNNVEEFKKYVYDMLMEQEQISYDAKVEQAIVEQIIAGSEFKKDLPQEMLDRYKETLTTNLTSEAARNEKTLEEFMMLYYGMDNEAFLEEVNNQAVKSAQQYIVLQAIADTENLNVSDEELQTEMETMAANAGYESVDDYKEVINAKGYREFMMGEKVMGVLKENAKINGEEE